MNIYSDVIYNPRMEEHKTPFGAVRTYERVFFNIHVKNTLQASRVTLVLREDKDLQQIKIDFSPKNVCNDYTIWSGEFTAQRENLYFYRFEIFKGEDIIFCGKNKTDSSAIIGDWLEEWQLTVYKEDFKVPEWFGQGVIYQIFTDRFFKTGHSSDLKGRVLRQDWYEPPYIDNANNDFFGGNLEGVIEKLDYLTSLGVTCIYLNPIFEAYSNHKYDTGDYMTIDPMFGDTEAFNKLCTLAKEKGIRIILDGVFSHTGSDSIYFNKKGTYGKGGAYRDRNSPFYSWYNFTSWPDDYKCWWGVKTLPEVNEEEPSYLSFIAGEQGVVKHWLKNGASGWRLDVADELPDVFLDRLRESVKETKEDAIIIGEVWEDASNKESYGKRRRYLLGSQLDSVMNYPFKSAILDFVKKGDAKAFKEDIMGILENYPKPSIECLMNIIGTHDTVRAITALSPVDSSNMDKPEKAKFKMEEKDYEEAKKLLKLASVLQFTLPGVPCIYYGDEAGLEGYEDPLNRRCYPWNREDKDLLDWYRKLGKIRNEYKKDFSEELIFHHAKEGLVVFSRGKITIAVNADRHKVEFDIPQNCCRDVLTEKTLEKRAVLENRECFILLK